MKANLVLLTLGTLAGILLGVFVGKSIIINAVSVPEGAAFENLTHLRKTMLERDERDTKSNTSVSFRSTVVPHPSDDIIYELGSNLDVKFHRQPLQTNSCGMRDIERPIKKGDNVFRIALLGDSYAFGWGVTREETFAHVLENTLNEYTKNNPRVEVLNFAVPGYSTFQEVAKFEEIGLDFNPDAVLVYFVSNDFDFPFYIKSFEEAGKIIPERTYTQKKGYWSSKSATRKKMNRLLKSHNPNIWLKRLAAITKKRGINLYLAINPRKKWRQDRHRLRVLKKRDHIRLLSLRPQFVQIVYGTQIPHKTLSLPHDRHPSALRHKIIGQILADELIAEIL